MNLAAKDAYIQKLASKVISQQQEPRKIKPFVHFKGKNNQDPPQKKRKTIQDKQSGGKSPKIQQKPPSVLSAKKGAVKAKLNHSNSTERRNGTAADVFKGNSDSSFSTVDLLRKRLHEKIEESRGQGAPKDFLSEAVQAKRAKRKMERERKKRKRKEIQMKKLAETANQEQPVEVKKEKEQAPAVSKRDETAIIFNRVETVEKEYVDKMLKKKEKKKQVKGNITPLTGRNYKQLLSRVEARKTKLKQLKETNEDKARDFENKMKWTNVLYKAEGLKIKDDEDMLRASLKKKEKKRAERKKQWEQRSENVVEKMQQRQDKRKKNLQRRKEAKIEKKKDRARKKGRILPEDLKKAAV